MDAEKFTKKSLEVIESCEKLAYEYNNQELTQAHLMYALVTVEDSLIAKLLTNMGINMDAFTGECEKLVANRPKVSGGQLFTSPEFSKALIQAEKEAKQMGDDYISVEHIFLGLLEKADKDIKRVINAYGITRGKFLEVLANIRGNRKVESDNPEDTYDALNKYGYNLVEREREIIAFRSTPYYRVVAQFYAATDPDKTLFKAELSTRFDTREEAETFLRSCIDARFTVAKAEEKPAQRYPAPPFTTSTLQQEAGRKLGMSVSQTMSVAQHLYEQGLITYMRTDSVNLSKQAIGQCKEEIIKLFGEKYSSAHNYKTKTKGAQEAHEAIRPSYIERQTIEGTPAEKKLYDLIWKRTVASQMVPAELDRTTIVIDISGSDAQFVATGEVIRFDGFLKLYSESTDEEPGEEGSGILPKMAQGESVNPAQITATERFTAPPARYNEASLVKRLEELGIGRPSTYAPTITTIINRGYVVKQNKEGQKRSYVQLTLTGSKIAEKRLTETYGKEKNRLQPTDIGMVVNDYLESQFEPIMDYNFTANVEKEFDRIADGEITWNSMIDDFYGPFHKMVDHATTTQTTKNNQIRILGTDPATGHTVKARIGRYGPMVEIEGNEGEKSRFASLKKGQLIESLTLEEALALFSLPRNLGPYEGEDLVIGIGKFGPYVRHGKSFASLARTDDPYTIGYDRAAELVREQQARAAAANTPLKTFAEEPELLIKNGRYGPYIAYKGKNYRIPKGTKPEEITLEACMKIIQTSKK